MMSLLKTFQLSEVALFNYVISFETEFAHLVPVDDLPRYNEIKLVASLQRKFS